MGNAAHHAPLQLGGSSDVTISLVACALVAGAAGAIGVGKALDHRQARREAGVPSGQPPTWVLSLLVASYSILVPGLVCPLLSFNISVLAFGQATPLRTETDTMTTFVRMLAGTGCWPGAALLVLYAMVIPCVKLVLLVLGEWLRHSDSPDRVKQAAFCTRAVQAASKWACPDMFAWVLLMCLVRGLGGPGKKLVSAAKLDVGFTCFCVFCIGSTASSLGIQVPNAYKLPGEPPEKFGRRKTALIDEEIVEGGLPMWLPDRLAEMGSARRGKLVMVAFLMFLGLGLYLPCMSMRLEMERLSIPAALAPLVNSLHLQEAAASDVSILMCIQQLLLWSIKGEVNSAIALVLLVVFVICVTCASMAVLMFATLELSDCDSESSPRSATLRKWMDWAYVLRRLAMLDVMIMGIFVVYGCMFAYRSGSVVLYLNWGVPWLLVAEICHYIQYEYVTADIKLARHRPHSGSQSSGEDGDQRSLLESHVPTRTR